MSRTCTLALNTGSARGRRTRSLAAASLVAAIWASACGDGGTEPTPVDPPRPTTVAVAPDTVTFTTLGDTARLAAEVSDQDGRVMPGAHVTWLTRNSTVAEVTSAGRVMAVGTGTTIVVGEIREASDSVVIRVDAPSFTLSGTVTDSRRPSLVLPGVLVRLEGWKRTTTITDADGRYRFPNLGGTLKVTVEAELSYVSRTVELNMDADVTRDFAMEHSGVTPFSNTTWRSSRILGPSGTPLPSITYLGRAMRTLYDRRLSNWIPVKAFVFEAPIAEQVVEFRLHPEYDSLPAATEVVNRFAPALAQLPAAFLSNVRALAIIPGDGLAGGSSFDQSILIHSQSQNALQSLHHGLLEELYLHEAAHVSLDPEHADAAGWRAAQEADGVFISEYARQHPNREDVAESAVIYFAVRYQPGSLTREDRWTVLTTIPNRLAYFEEQDLDMSPYEARGSLVPGVEPGSVASSLQRTVLPAPEAAAVAGEVAVSPREQGTCQGEPEDPAQPWTAWEYPQELLDGPCAFPGVAGGCARPHQLERLLEARGVDPGEAGRHSVFLPGDDLDGARRVAAPQVVDEAQADGAVAIVDDGITGGRARDHMPRGCG